MKGTRDVLLRDPFLGSAFSSFSTSIGEAFFPYPNHVASHNKQARHDLGPPFAEQAPLLCCHFFFDFFFFLPPNFFVI